MMSFDHWLRLGIELGHCGPPVCDTHDGTPMTEEEAEQRFDGGEPCIHAIRPYSSPDHKKEVEDAHPPSTWRDTWTKASGLHDT